MILLSKFLLKKQLIPLVVSTKLINAQIRTFYNSRKYLKDSGDQHADDKSDTQAVSSKDVTSSKSKLDKFRFAKLIELDKIDKPPASSKDVTSSKSKLDKLNRRFGKLIELDKIDMPSQTDLNRSAKPTFKFQFKKDSSSEFIDYKSQVVKRFDKSKEENTIKNLARLINKKNPERGSKELLKPFERTEKKSKTTPERMSDAKLADKQLSFEDFANRLETLIDKSLTKKSKDRIAEGDKSDTKAIAPVKKKLVEDQDGSKREDLEKRQTVESSRSTTDESNEICDLNSGQGFLLFDASSFKESKTPESPIWSKYYTDEIVSQSECMPMNGFDEAILLTNEGRLWRFPIDNEQDEDVKEQQIPFHKHVLLEETYLGQFPHIDQVQKFMQLILNGLSHNSFMSLNEKLEVIDWYKSYFAENESMIRDAIEAEDYANSLTTQSTSTGADYANIPQARRRDDSI